MFKRTYQNFITRMSRTFLVSGFAVLALLLLAASCAPNPAGAHASSNYTSNPTSANGGPMLVPFTLDRQPMQRLLLIDFTKSAEPYYKGLELQSFDDEIHGKGLLVLAYRRDGRVDLYHQPSLVVGREFDGISQEETLTYEREMPDARFNVTERGVDVRYSFKDVTGRVISVILKEDDPQRFSFPLLAPLGDGMKNPSKFPLFLLYDFSLTRRTATQVDVRIAGEPIQPDVLPIPIHWSPVYVIRYALDPVILNWNSASNGQLEDARLSSAGIYEAGGLLCELNSQDGKRDIRTMRPAQDLGHDLAFNFDPPFPDLAAMADGARTGGTFTIAAGESMGAIHGEYSVERDGDRLDVRLHPGGWEPQENDLSLQVMYFIIKMFKNWPATYEWRAEIDLRQEPPAMVSGWTRNTP